VTAGPQTPPGSPPAGAGPTYLVVDGENIDATLGNSVLKRRPAPEERPRWDRVREFAEGVWGQPVKGLFFLNASSGSLPMGFVQALMAMDYQPIPLAGQPDQKVVDIGIQRTLDAIAERSGDVLLASHDGDFLPYVTRLLEDGRRVGVLGLREFVNAGFPLLAAQGLQIFDLEDQAAAFTSVLPRVRVIQLEDFDPVRFL
jgi:putative heme uptake system protein